MNNLIETLHSVSSKLPDIENESQIYQILNDGIKQILPNSYFIITKLQPDDMNFRITHSFGFDKYFTAIKALLGKDPFQMDFPFDNLSEQKQKQFESRKLYHASGGIYEIAIGKVNKTICKTIEKILGISEVYAISFCVGKNYFGGSSLFIPKATIESGKLSKECILTIESLASQVSFAISKLRDFEALTKNENELKESELRWQFAIEGNSDGLWDWNLITNKVFFSEQWKKMLGFSANEISNNIEEWSKRVHPDDVKKVNEDVDNHLNGITDYYENEHRVLCKNNTYKWILDRGKIISYTADNKPARMIGTHSDISERKKTENELEKSVSLLTATLESTADGILVVDHNGKFASYNNKFKELWHVPDSAISKHDIDEEPLMPIALNQLSDPDSFLAKVKELYLSKDTSFDLLHFKDGRIYERYSQAQILDGKSLGRVWSFRDVTEHNKAELELKESEQKFRNVFEQATIGL